MALRLLWSWYAARPPRGLNDPFTYVTTARFLADGRGYIAPFTFAPTAYFPPGYSFYLAPFMWAEQHVPGLTGRQPSLTALSNVAASASVIWLTMTIASRFVDRRGSLIAGMIVAVWPNLVLASSVALSEQLFLALFLAAIVVAMQAAHHDRATLRILCVGGLIAGAALVRPIALLAAPPLIVYTLPSRIHFGRRLGLVVVGCVLVLTPWTIRNLVTMHSFVPLSNNSGDNFCIGHHDGAEGAFELTEACNPRVRATGAQREVARTKEQWLVGLRYATRNPLSEVRLVGQRLFATVRDDADSVAASESYGEDIWMNARLRTLLRVVSTGYWYVIGSLGTVGLVDVARRGRDGRGLALIAIAVVVVPVVVFFGDPRFKIPAVPMLAIATAWLIERGRSTWPANIATGEGGRRSTRGSSATVSDRPADWDG